MTRGHTEPNEIIHEILYVHIVIFHEMSVEKYFNLSSPKITLRKKTLNFNCSLITLLFKLDLEIIKIEYLVQKPKFRSMQ